MRSPSELEASRESHEKGLNPKDKVSNRYLAAPRVPILLTTYVSRGAMTLLKSQRQTKAQEGLSHPDGEAAREEQRRPLLLGALAPNSHREKSLTSKARKILALGDVDIEDRGTHPPAEDRDPGHSAGQPAAVRTSHRGECRELPIFCSLPPAWASTHGAVHPTLTFSPGPAKVLAMPKGKPQRNGPSRLQPPSCF